MSVTTMTALLRYRDDALPAKSSSAYPTPPPYHGSLPHPGTSALGFGRRAIGAKARPCELAETADLRPTSETESWLSNTSSSSAYATLSPLWGCTTRLHVLVSPLKPLRRPGAAK